MSTRTVAALIAVAFLTAVGLFAATQRSDRPAPRPAAQLAPPPASDGRVLLSDAQRREAAASGTWLRDIRSLLPVGERLEYGDYLWDDVPENGGEVWVRVDLRTQLLSVFRGGHEIGSAVVLYGADSKETPLGTFPILWKGRNHRSSLYDAEMPYTMRLTGDGVAIHGSDVRWGAATHGCIGTPTEFAAKLFEIAKVGTRVLIVRSDPPSAPTIRTS